MSKKSEEKVSVVVHRHCAANGIPAPDEEHQFHETRRWRFDYAWLAERVAIECQGGLFIGGKHGRGYGILRDYEKLNTAQLGGWIVLQFAPEELRKGSFVAQLREALKLRGAILKAKRVSAADDFDDDFDPAA